MRFAFLLLILAFATFSGAVGRAENSAPLCEAPSARGPSSVAAPNGVTIIEASPGVNAGEMRKQGYNVRPLAAAVDVWEDPSPTLRDRLLKSAGLWPAVKGWDQLARDQIFLRAQHYSATKLATKYPSVSKTLLQALQTSITKEKARLAAGSP